MAKNSDDVFSGVKGNLKLLGLCVAALVVVGLVLIGIDALQNRAPSDEQLERSAVRECERALRSADITVPDALYPSRKGQRPDEVAAVFEVTSGTTVCNITLNKDNGELIASSARRK